jgi:hypothetical protein
MMRRVREECKIGLHHDSTAPLQKKLEIVVAFKIVLHVTYDRSYVEIDTFVLVTLANGTSPDSRVILYVPIT